MRVALVGLPGSNKSGMAKEIAGPLDLKIIDNIPQNIFRRMGVSVGGLCDYRVEVLMAAERFEKWQRFPEVVMTTTLFDSFAYSLVRADLRGYSDPEANLTLMMITRFFQDSFDYDEIHWIKKEPADEWEEKVVEGYEAIWRDYLGPDTAARLHVHEAKSSGQGVGRSQGEST